MSGSPRANAQTCHEYGQDDRDRGGGYAELSHRQPQPDELIQDTAEAGNEEEGKVPARADARRPCLRIGTLGPNLNRMNFYIHVNGFCAHKLLRFRDLGWGGWENPGTTAPGNIRQIAADAGNCPCNFSDTNRLQAEASRCHGNQSHMYKLGQDPE